MNKHKEIIELLEQGHLKKDIPDLAGVSYGLVRKVTKGIESKNRYKARKKRKQEISYCAFCGKECKSKVSVIQHEIRCESNPNKIEVIPSYGMLGKKGKGSNQYIKGTAKPLTDEQRKKMSERSKGRKWSEEKRKRHSERMKEAVRNNPESYSVNNIIGRVKQIDYNGVLLKGNWEVKTAKWLDDKNIEWQYEPQAHPYVFEGRDRLYFPDFYLPEHNVYLEVKGFETEQDRAKWNQLKADLVVIDRRAIDKLDNYSIIELIEDFKYLPR